MKLLLLCIGLAAFAMGLLWVGQGFGYIKWPASSFMISQTKWIYYGAGLSVAGLVIIWFSQR
jgi:uncharacterized membrane protein